MPLQDIPYAHEVLSADTQTLALEAIKKAGPYEPQTAAAKLERTETAIIELIEQQAAGIANKVHDEMTELAPNESRLIEVYPSRFSNLYLLQKVPCLQTIVENINRISGLDISAMLATEEQDIGDRNPLYVTVAGILIQKGKSLHRGQHLLRTRS